MLEQLKVTDVTAVLGQCVHLRTEDEDVYTLHIFLYNTIISVCVHLSRNLHTECALKPKFVHIVCPCKHFLCII